MGLRIVARRKKRLDRYRNARIRDTAIRKILIPVWLVVLAVACCGARGGEGLPVGHPLLNPVRPGKTAKLFSFSAKFRFRWSGLDSGEAEINFASREDGNYAVWIEGSSRGIVRSLWKMDASYRGEGVKDGLVPLWFWQEERYARHRVWIDAKFSEKEVGRRRQREPSDETNPWKQFSVPGVRDLFSAMLLIRSLGLDCGETVGVLCFSGESFYWVEASGFGKETVRWNGRETAAWRVDIRAQRVETKGDKKGQLTPHGLFRGGTVWMSDDGLHLPFRGEAKLFWGTAQAEMESFSLNPTPHE